jgi:hypothetical protein
MQPVQVARRSMVPVLPIIVARLLMLLVKVKEFLASFLTKKRSSLRIAKYARSR